MTRIAIVIIVIALGSLAFLSTAHAGSLSMKEGFAGDWCEYDDGTRRSNAITYFRVSKDSECNLNKKITIKPNGVWKAHETYCMPAGSRGVL